MLQNLRQNKGMILQIKSNYKIALYLCSMNASKNERQIATWLFIGVAMIMIQFLLGSITRLTESGLSITEWKPIKGAIPPLTEAAWQVEFEKYRHTDQFRFVHTDFSLRDFKFIFFWEWFHRFWARMIGIVFLIGFVYFLVKRKMSRNMMFPMILLFVLGGLQGAIGWIMVKSGLVPEMYFVGHVELTTHLIAAMAVLVFTFWFGLKLSLNNTVVIYDSRVLTYLIALLCLIVVQMIYGGFMAGLKAAQSAPTWPDINGYWIPNLKEQNLYVQFIHRGLGYLIFVLNIVLFFKTAHLAQHSLYRKLRLSLAGLIKIQVILGILSLIFATQKNSFLILGVLHQFNALLVLLTLVYMLYVVRKTKPAVSSTTQMG